MNPLSRAFVSLRAAVCLFAALVSVPALADANLRVESRPATRPIEAFVRDTAAAIRWVQFKLQESGGYRTCRRPGLRAPRGYCRTRHAH